jgi:predicted nucleic acid-binding protein
MPWAILDTNVYIGHWERGLYEKELAQLRKGFIVRHSAVVLSELRRGARTRTAQRVVGELAEKAHIQWEPTSQDWWQTGELIRQIGDARSWDKKKRRDFQNDTLIALTAHRNGATVVTADKEDFELLAGAIGTSVLYV